MFRINRFTLVSLWLLGAYLLSACGGALDQSPASGVAPKVLTDEIVFTGIVESMNGNQWLVGGQTIAIDPATAIHSNVTVGALVKAEGTVSSDGTVVALKIESSAASADRASDSDDDTDKIFGVVEAITADSITIDGATYQIVNFTEFEDVVTVGDQVEIEVAVNVDGTSFVLEIEKVDDLDDVDDIDDVDDDDTDDVDDVDDVDDDDTDDVDDIDDVDDDDADDADDDNDDADDADDDNDDDDDADDNDDD